MTDHVDPCDLTVTPGPSRVLVQLGPPLERELELDPSEARAMAAVLSHAADQVEAPIAPELAELATLVERVEAK